MGGVDLPRGFESLPLRSLTDEFWRARASQLCIASAFDTRTVALAPGETLAYDEQEWRDALVTVGRGEVELVMSCGRSCFFQSGDMLWFQGLPVARLHNRGDEPAVLVATTRKPGVA